MDDAPHGVSLAQGQKSMGRSLMDAMGSGLPLGMETALNGLVKEDVQWEMTFDFFHGPVQHNTSDAQGCVGVIEPSFTGKSP